MRKIHTLFIAAAFLTSAITACQNPVEKGKGIHHKDLQDTNARKTEYDSTGTKSHVNPEDTLRKN